MLIMNQHQNKKTKTTKSKSKQKKNTPSTRRSGRTFKSKTKLTKTPKHDLINTDYQEITNLNTRQSQGITG